MKVIPETLPDEGYKLFIVIILRKNVFFYEIYREKSEVTNAHDR
jgi:hypothetical protein